MPCFLLFNDHFTDCFPGELWNLQDTRFTFLSDLSSLEDADQYPSCDDGSTASVVLRDNRLNTATVAYYNATTTGSRACFVCNESSGHALNTTTNERVCQSDGTWSGNPIICGTLQNLWCAIAHFFLYPDFYHSSHINQRHRYYFNLRKFLMHTVEAVWARALIGLV